MDKEIKVTNIIHSGPGRRSVAALIDLGIVAAVGLGLFFLLSFFVFEPISRAVPTVDYEAFDNTAQEVMDIQVESGLFYYDEEKKITDIFDDKTEFEDYDSIIQNYYFVYLQTPDLIPPADAQKFTPYWYNVFIYGLPDEQNLYQVSELNARYDIVKNIGATYFQYQVDGSNNKLYDQLAIIKNSHYVNQDPNGELSDSASSALLNYFYNGNLNYTISGVASIYVLTIETDFATRAFFADVYAHYRELAYQVSVWQTLLPELTAIFIVSILAYFVMPLIFKNGKTIGKLVMGIGLVNKLGYDVSIPQLIMRFFFPMVVTIGLLIIGGTAFAIGMGLFVLISYALVIFTKEHKAIHDYLAGTVAVDAKRSVWFKNAKQEAEYTEKINQMPRLDIEKQQPINDTNLEK
ncbi:MAG: RDD family protein [Bacilli bacterium]